MLGRGSRRLEVVATANEAWSGLVELRLSWLGRVQAGLYVSRAASLAGRWSVAGLAWVELGRTRCWAT